MLTLEIATSCMALPNAAFIVVAIALAPANCLGHAPTSVLPNDQM